MAEAELFSIGAESPQDDPFTGMAFASAEAAANADFSRGINVGATFDLVGQLGAAGKFGEMISVGLSAGGSIRAGVNLQAFAPMDVFGTGAGVVGRIRAQAEAAAYMRATVTLARAALIQKLKVRWGDTEYTRFIEEVLNEVDFETGVWGRVAIALELVGEAVFTGTLNPDREGGAGFTASVQYAVGYIYGSGIQFIANGKIPDPERLVAIASRFITRSVSDALEEELRTSGREATDAEKIAVSMLRLVMPLALQAAYQTGMALADEDAEGNEAAVDALESCLARSLREAISHLVLEAGADELSHLLSDLGLVSGTGEDPLFEADLVEHLVALRNEIAVVQDESIGSLLDQPGKLSGVMGALRTLIGNGFFGSTLGATLLPTIASLWSAVEVYRAVAAETGAPDPGSLEAAFPELTSAAEQCIRDFTGDISSISVAGHLQYLSARLGLPSESAPPWLATALDEMAGFVGMDRDAFIAWIADLVRAREIPAATVAQGLVAVLNDRLIPDLLDSIGTSQPGTTSLIEKIIVPILDAVGTQLLPKIAATQTKGERREFREAASAVLLQLFADAILGALSELLDMGVEKSVDALKDVADEVEEAGESSSEYAVSTAALELAGGMILAPADIANLLRFGAELTNRWHSQVGSNILDAVRACIGTSGTRTLGGTLTTIESTSDAPRKSELQALFDESADGVIEIAVWSVPKILEIVAKAFWNKVKALAMALYNGTKAAVRAAKKAIEWVGRQLDELRQRLREIADAIASAVQAIVDQVLALIGSIGDLLEGVVDEIRNEGRRLVRSLAPGWAEDACVEIFNALFNAVSWASSSISSCLHGVANLVGEVIADSIDLLTLDADSVRDRLRDRILSSDIGSRTFHITLSAWGKTILELPTITISGGFIRQALCDVVLGDGGFDSAVGYAVNAASSILPLKSEHEVVAQAKANLEANNPAAQIDTDDLDPAGPIEAKFRHPVPKKDDEMVDIAEGEVFHVSISGITPAYVQETLGVPPRVQLLVNGVSLQIAPSCWTRRRGGQMHLELPVIVGPSRAPVAVRTRSAGVLRAHAVVVEATAEKMVLETAMSGSFTDLVAPQAFDMSWAQRAGKILNRGTSAGSSVLPLNPGPNHIQLVIAEPKGKKKRPKRKGKKARNGKAGKEERRFLFVNLVEVEGGITITQATLKKSKRALVLALRNGSSRTVDLSGWNLAVDGRGAVPLKGTVRPARTLVMTLAVPYVSRRNFVSIIYNRFGREVSRLSQERVWITKATLKRRRKVLALSLRNDSKRARDLTAWKVAVGGRVYATLEGVLRPSQTRTFAVSVPDVSTQRFVSVVSNRFGREVAQHFQDVAAAPARRRPQRR